LLLQFPFEKTRKINSFKAILKAIHVELNL
jgi:hypothetical protein